MKWLQSYSISSYNFLSTWKYFEGHACHIQDTYNNEGIIEKFSITEVDCEVKVHDTYFYS